MESALLSASLPLLPQNRGVSGLLRNFQSSFYGKVLCSKRILRRDIYANPRNSVLVASATLIRDTLLKPETGLAGGLAYTNNLIPAVPTGLLGLLLLFQANNSSEICFLWQGSVPQYACLFGGHGLTRLIGFPPALECSLKEVKVGDELEEAGENVFVGGKNRWKYSTFVNWELWWPNFPILVYFKETQTKPEGQVHFFPVIFMRSLIIYDFHFPPPAFFPCYKQNGKQLYDVMVERAGPSKTSGPRES
ncbi:hypothetical protein RJ640_018129 [Escallonia rubra]|uniref:Uncharacterized protein n=1 Tax=Escallonia rubra TaxID=112253 RepID=A0AA88UGK8_9ASTE|nr:hypothetical protein RJ640_018129 [Escallonia rubra]